MFEGYLDLRSPVEKTLIDYKMDDPLGEAEYVALTAIVRALKPIKLGCGKPCGRDVTRLSAKGVFSFTIEERAEENCLFIEIEGSIKI